ncbi:TetR/AcrR family transcriptional regulator [Amycolatopsis sp. FDAARGOS 1241]|uniref:TetR/AcrR family transcriptional regulator n=1 Tax=Amycolatopsis sp. FDAARGOS 1241 TaxID=2778070 RepID=UPI00194F94EC|nr:TetR/AcrR family transcriptional regulator [Amycolatopsis sp. FDAARGOS 1241]QRP48176.1 TetR/AcrR family transcriptional regulator [Amycolatopsis sp. FDAARGOS 1241]
MTPDRPRRSSATRAAILDAARERFAADGYERATIRAIAADAAIDPSMVMRYYGSKEKLFAAAADFDLRLPDFAELRREHAGELLVRHVLNRWSDDETLFALLRAGVTNPAAAERMRTIFAAQLGPQVAKVCPDPAEAPLRAGLISTQVLGLALCRFVLKLPPVADLTGDEAVRWLGPTLQRYLTGS